MSDSRSSSARAAYREGVERLVDGDAREALRILEPWLEREPTPELHLAIGKSHLALGHGRDAARMFAFVSSAKNLDTGLQAYVKLLVAVAAALAGEQENAMAAIDDSIRLDGRMERAGSDLRRRIQAGEPPTLAF